MQYYISCKIYIWHNGHMQEPHMEEYHALLAKN